MNRGFRIPLLPYRFTFIVSFRPGTISMKCLLVSGILTILLAGVRPGLAVDATYSSANAVLKKYCLKCHTGDEPKGELNFATIAPEIEKNADAWKRVVDRLTDGTMPPPG